MTEFFSQSAQESNHAFTFRGPPRHDLIPLVVDSPHSSPVMPCGAGCIAPREALMSSIDAYVDELWCYVPEVGGQLLCAEFHRAFIDVNRSALDIDPRMLASAWPTLTQPSAKSQRGMGLIRRFALPGVPMYDRLLTVPEVQHRLRTFYVPYHDRLGLAMDQAGQQFPQVWHINCHSMKSVGNAMNEDDGERRPDFVISDADGTTADPADTAWVARWWRDAGYSVGINHPYKGGEIIRRFGKPAQRRHSIQIEINRRLYMDEKTFARTPGFEGLTADVARFLVEMRGYIFRRLATTTAEQPLAD